MEIIYHKTFKKKFAKFPEKLKKKTIKVVDLFTEDPFHPSLKNHVLGGPMKNQRSISVTGDIRIVFEEHDGYLVVLFLDIGPHDQVYR